MSGLLVATVVALCSAAAANKTSGVDCSQFQQSASVDQVQVRFTAVLDKEVGPNGYLHAEVTIPGQGWVGFGYSANGNMVPGYAVIGLPGVANSATNPGKYNMQGESPGPGGVYLMDSSMQTLTNASITTTSSSTILTFTKRLIESNDLAINGEGPNNFMVAYGSTTSSLSYHTYRSSFVYTLQSCINGGAAVASTGGSIVVTGKSMEKQLWTAHGVFAAVAWGVLAPVAIAASLLRRIFIASDLPALWFKIHQTVNVTVFIFTALSFAFAVRAIDLQQKEHFKGVKHRTTGLVIMVLLCVQILMGILRPHLPHPKEPEEDALETDGEASEEPTKAQPAPKKSITRILWEIMHRLLGFLLIGFSWWQVGNGLGLYATYFSEKDLSNVFWIITGALSTIILFLYGLMSMEII